MVNKEWFFEVLPVCAVCDSCMHTQKHEAHWVSFLYGSLPFVLRQDLLTHLNLIGAPGLDGQRSPEICPSAPYLLLPLPPSPPWLGLHTCTTMPSFLCGLRGSKLRSLQLCGRHFTIWAISTGPSTFLKWQSTEMLSERYTIQHRTSSLPINIFQLFINERSHLVTHC